jgi:hypothetical protein
MGVGGGGILSRVTMRVRGMVHLSGLRSVRRVDVRHMNPLLHLRLYFPYLVARGKGELAAIWHLGRGADIKVHAARIDVGESDTPSRAELE